jgi:hypothetical protein
MSVADTSASTWGQLQCSAVQAADAHGMHTLLGKAAPYLLKLGM